MHQLKLLFASLLSLTASIAFSQNKYESDFLEFWSDYNENYAYMSEQHIDWNKVKEIYLPEARQIQADYEFVRLLEKVTHELHNGHISLNMSYDTSNRIIPSGADIFVEKSGYKFFITDIKENSKAAACGLKAGTEVVKFGNKPVEGQLANFLPRYAATYDASMYSYAVNMLFAGVHNTEREITVIENGQEKTYYPDKEKVETSKALLEVKILDKNIGYIRINNSLGNYDLIAAFDEALDELKNTKAIILDLTDTPSGGNTTIARAIMGRFIEKELPYQKHVLDEKKYETQRSWIEYVVPRKTPYKNKLVVMEGHWTGSMGEGMVIGFDAMKRAKITGTKMAGLLGAIYTFRTAQTNVGYQIPMERMYHVNGTPREDYLPPYLTSNSNDTFQKALKLAQ